MFIEKFCKVTTNFYYRNPDNFESIINGGNEIRSSIKEGKYKVISFADRNNERIMNMKRFRERVSNYSTIDDVHIFTLSDIDSKFIRDYHSLFEGKFFAWISKIYFTYKTLLNSNYGDVILWIDSDIVDILEDGIDNLYNLCNNSEKGIVGFHNDFWLERLFTKRDLYKHLDIDSPEYWDTNQAYGGFFLVKKNDFTINFFKQWIDVATTPGLFNDSPSKSENLDGFITHKYCQSILSLLFKKYNIKTFPLPLYDLDSTNVIGIHSGYFNDNIKLPLVWESCWHNVSIREQWESCNRKFGKKVSPENCLSSSINYFK